MDRNYLLTITTALWCLPTANDYFVSLCNDPNCEVCSPGGNNCNVCKHGCTFTSNICSLCPNNCLTCTAVGYCQSCSPGFWGYQCLNICPDNCDENGCDNISGNCFKCIIGPQCNQDCNHCENEQCELHKCMRSTGCKDGYVEDIYNNVADCIPCSSYCKQCNYTSLCTKCFPGYFIYQYTVEDKTVATCVSCSSVVSKCVDCTYDQNQASCKSCEAGNVHVVNEDNRCVTTVPFIQCQNGCDSEGRCFGGCQPGWSGPLCNYECSYACLTCINQDACLSCKDGFYTQMCTVPCNTNCKPGNYPLCRFVDGYRSNGCNKSFWGDQCENICNNNYLDITAASELCHRNGTCYYGCKAGYMGSDCSQVTSVLTSLVSTTSTRASTAILNTKKTHIKDDLWI